MPFPVFKLGYMAIRQISKPLAKQVKVFAKDSPLLRNYVLIPPAQLYHSLETGFKMRLMGLGKAKEVKPLNEDMAVELGADMLSEVFVYGVAAFTVFLEYRRQQRKEARHESDQNTRLDDLENEIKELGLKVEEQNTHIRELSRIIYSTPTLLTDPKSGIKLDIQKDTSRDTPQSIVDSKSNIKLDVRKPS